MKKYILLFIGIILFSFSCFTEEKIKEPNYSQYSEVDTNSPAFAKPTSNNIMDLGPKFVRRVVEEDGTVIEIYFNKSARHFWADVNDKKLRDYSIRGLGTQIKMELGLPY